MCHSLLMRFAKFFHQRYYWDHIEPSAVIALKVRKIHGETVKLDIRNFFVNPECAELQQIVKTLNDVDAIVSWVRNNIAFKSEQAEFWELPFETLTLRKADCDGQNILLANLLVASSLLESWQVRLNAGSTSAGPHVWVTIFQDGKWVIKDAVIRSVKYKEVWFSWHSQKAFTSKEKIEEWKT